MVSLDRHIAISAGWVAGPAFGVAMMAAPEALGLSHSLSVAVFWGGMGVFFITLLLVAILSAFEQERRKRRVWPIALMASGLALFGVGLAWYLWPRPNTTIAEQKAASTRPDVIPLASLRYVTASMRLDYQGGESPISAEMSVVLENATDTLMSFKGSLTGSVNGKEPHRHVMPIEGFIYPHGQTTLVYDRVFDFPTDEPDSIIVRPYDPTKPYVAGLLSYDIVYGAASSNDMARTTTRNLRFELWRRPVRKAPGAIDQIPVTVIFDGETEK